VYLFDWFKSSFAQFILLCIVDSYPISCPRPWRIVEIALAPYED
jgi:hypothetical protein